MTILLHIGNQGGIEELIWQQNILKAAGEGPRGWIHSHREVRTGRGHHHGVLNLIRGQARDLALEPIGGQASADRPGSRQVDDGVGLGVLHLALSLFDKQPSRVTTVIPENAFRLAQRIVVAQQRDRFRRGCDGERSSVLAVDRRDRFNLELRTVGRRPYNLTGGNRGRHGGSLPIPHS